MQNKFLLPLFLLPCFLWSQQTPFMHFFQQNWIWVNPAAVDKSFIFNEQNPFILHASYREQWIGVDGAPRNYYIGFEHKPAGDENYKWGFQFFGEQTGNISSYGGYFNYSYSIKLPNSRSRRLYFGINGGIIRYGINRQGLKLKDPGDPVENGEDILYADFSFGLFYQGNRRFYAGLSVPQTFSLNVQANGDDSGIAPERVPHVYLVLGGFIGEADYCRNCAPDFLFEPSIWIRYTPDVPFYTILDQFPFSIDASLRTYFRGQFWFGAGYSTNQNLAFEVGINKGIKAILGDKEDKVRVGLGYNVPFLNNNLQLGHSIELNLAYAWN